MARLTKRKRNSDGTGIAKFDVTTVNNSLTKAGRNIITKLADYEDLEEHGLLVRLPCEVGDKIWELCLCDDGNYRIFPMIVKSISKYGALRQVGKDTTIWHIYAESDYMYVYKNFIDLGKTWFLTREEAKKKLEEMKLC